MTATPLGTVQGLASNVQWQDLITQIIQQETTQKLTPITNQITTDNTSVSAWQSYQGLMTTFQQAASTLSTDGFDAMQSSTVSDAGGKQLASVTATSSATPGTYQMQVLSLATADKVGGGIISSASNPLNLSGEFFVNGDRVSVTASDSLNSIRDKINALNSGTTGTSVSASVLSIGTSSNRLTLTSSQNGVGGIQLADGSTGVLAALGLVPSTGTSTTTPAGGGQSYRFANSSTAIGTLLGAASVPPATTIDVGNTTISVDLSTDTLNSIQAKMAAAGVSASVSTPTFNGTTMAELDVNAPVAADPNDPNSQRVLDLLGFSNTRAAVTQTVADTSAWTTTGGAPATASTALSSINVGGTSVGLTAGDSITLSGTRGDGVPVSTTITLDGTETVQTLLDKINATTAWGNTSRSATATIGADGTLQMADSTAGASQLSLALTVNKASGGTATLGQVTTQTTGYNRAIVQGADAQVVIDGTLITRPTNTISDAVPGATITLNAAEPGTTGTFDVSHDTTTAVTDVQAFVSAYNALQSFVTTQTAAGGALPFNLSLRASLQTLTDNLVQNIPGLTGTYTRAGTVGLTLDKTGVLQLDATALTAALTSDLPDVKALFGVTATTSDGLAYLTDTANTKSGTFGVNVTSAATKATLTGTGFSGTYVDSGSPDNVTITDGATLATGSVSLSSGDDMDTIVDKFNAMFTSKSMQLTATNVGGQLSITSNTYGSAAKFNLSFDSGTNVASQLGISAGQNAGTDIAGTIDGVAAVGSGQILTGASGSDVDGLALQYAGTAPYTGQITHTVGLASQMSNIANTETETGDGLIANITTSLQTEITSLTSRQSDVQEQINNHQTALTQQFTAMETAIAQLQGQTASLTSQISGLQTSGA